MKRHPALKDLSREHHDALKLARAGREAALSGNESVIAACAARIARVFAAEMEPHFREEEIGLLPYLTGTGDDDLVWRTLLEHAELRALADALREPNAGTLLRFATLLAEHVRFEERTLFETAQQRGFAEGIAINAGAGPAHAAAARRPVPAPHP